MNKDTLIPKLGHKRFAYVIVYINLIPKLGHKSSTYYTICITTPNKSHPHKEILFIVFQKHAPNDQHQTFEHDQTEQHHFTQQNGTQFVLHSIPCLEHCSPSILPSAPLVHPSLCISSTQHLHSKIHKKIISQHNKLKHKSGIEETQ